MKRFGALLATAALGTAVVASGPTLARGGGGGGHMGGFGGGGHFGGFGGRSAAMGGFNRGFGFHRGFGFNRGFDHRFARFDHFRRFDRDDRFRRFDRDDRFFFRNRFSRFPFFWGGGFDYADCGFWGNCGYGNPGYANGYGYPDSAYSYPDYGNAYDYPATGASGYYSAAPLVTGRSVGYCTISVKACERDHDACSCWAPDGREPVAH